MYGPRCEYCRHYNQAGAKFCEECESPLVEDAGEPGGAAGGSSAWHTPADGIPSPPFKGAGDVLSPMLAVYRKHFTLVGVIVLLTTLPQTLLQYFVFVTTGATYRGGGLAGTLPFGLDPSGLLLWALTIAAWALMSGSLVYAVLDLQRAGRASARDCLARGLSALPKTFGVTLVYTLITGVGYLLFVVPGVIIGIMYAVCVPVVIVEGRGPLDALRRSYALTNGYKGLIFITYFLWWLLIFGLNWIIIASFARGGGLGLLSSMLLQSAVAGMLCSSGYVLTVYIYLGLLRERRSGFTKAVGR